MSGFRNGGLHDRSNGMVTLKVTGPSKDKKCRAYKSPKEPLLRSLVPRKK